jgi:hypothetical protein
MIVSITTARRTMDDVQEPPGENAFGELDGRAVPQASLRRPIHL